MPAKQAMRWMASATPVLAGAPAPTEGGVAFKCMCCLSGISVCPTFSETGAIPCGSGHAREAGDAMDGTGYAGVRGRARSHMGCAGLKAGDVHAGGGSGLAHVPSTCTIPL